MGGKRNNYFQFDTFSFKMHQEKYNLSWDSYSDHLKGMLHNMMKSEYLTDVTVVCDDKKKYKAHKMVLSACSTVFHDLINDLPQENSVIFLRGIQYHEMESILDYMYLGETTIFQDRMNEFLNVAKSLDIKEIKGISRNLKFDEVKVTSEEPEATESENDFEFETKPDMNLDETRTPSRNRKLIDDSQLQNDFEKAFHCEYCSKKFLTRGNLRQHIQSKHQGVKFDCNQCDQQFSQHGHLKRHIKSKHEGVIYSCSQCGHQCNREDNLRKHYQSSHNNI